MPPLNNERYYDASPEEVWPILKHLVEYKFKKVRVDEVSRGISFKTGVTGFTSGQNFEASLIPSGQGTLLRLSATSNVATNVGNGRAQSNAAAWIYQHVGEFILKERAKG